MRKCFACEQMSAVVTLTKKPDGKPGAICPTCKAAGKDPENDWYYWSQNQRAHFIVWRLQDNQVAKATVWKPIIPNGKYIWTVIGPCWSTYEETEAELTLPEAKKAVELRVMKIIEEEFRPEYVAPLG
jgi:hypothetical protein